MARRTKAEAEATRQRLLDAAEQLFQNKGVSRTSLADIAQAAGATRGAVYWHFKDKADLFNAMMERVTLPLEQTLQSAASDSHPMHELRQALLAALHHTEHDERTHRVFEVATHKVEYVQEMSAVRERHLRVRNECMAMTRQGLEAAARERGVELPLPAGAAALGLHVLLDGLIQNWLLDPQAFALTETGRQVVDTYLKGLGFNGAASSAPAPPGH